MPATTKPKSVKIRFAWLGEFIDQEWSLEEKVKCPHCRGRGDNVWAGSGDTWKHCLNCASLFKNLVEPIRSSEAPRVVGLLGYEMINHMTFDELNRLQALKRAVSNLE